ncbi:hypothetical protein M0657_007954 [Pyricularia oryzae]|uniref:Uncharacterized protein n=2 Tax=Pyricularia TaxID=48558 RepID=A0A6P8AYP8_PYRGI|nr:hypothetical protein PgNI_10330 [Pyricularia grisea]KAI7917624.1 hypothetical protein M0657_007954 [Pyricularia oryzae]KAI7918033.1 hypothetical protein M9X92_007103 [Pyricularia oryzae]TLD07460.1 hypothetical protein PgNI_10330 [Pyricularia grisea]
MGFARSQRRSVPSTQQGAGGSKSWRPASERIHTVDPWGNGNNDSRSQVLQVDL